jgi:hypothetical protein
MRCQGGAYHSYAVLLANEACMKSRSQLPLTRGVTCQQGLSAVGEWIGSCVHFGATRVCEVMCSRCICCPCIRPQLQLWSVITSLVLKLGWSGLRVLLSVVGERTRQLKNGSDDWQEASIWAQSLVMK